MTKCILGPRCRRVHLHPGVSIVICIALAVCTQGKELLTQSLAIFTRNILQHTSIFFSEAFVTVFGARKPDNVRMGGEISGSEQLEKGRICLFLGKIT